MWTEFWDMHSGGGCKQPPYEHIFIEAPRDAAIKVFYNRFGHNPERVSCTCCGYDYAVEEYDSLQQATAYQRACLFENDRYVEKPGSETYSKYQTLADYIKNDDVYVLFAEDINEQDLTAHVPVQGYVWIG